MCAAPNASLLVTTPLRRWRPLHISAPPQWWLVGVLLTSRHCLAGMYLQQVRYGSGGTTTHVNFAHLCWLCHIRCIEYNRIPKDMFNCEPATESLPVRPRYKYVSKPDLKVGNTDSAGWEAVAADCSKWRLAFRASEKRTKNLWEKRRP